MANDKFKILRASTLEKLTEAINESLKDGYRLSGAISTDPAGGFFQAVELRPVDPDKLQTR